MNKLTFSVRKIKRKDYSNEVFEGYEVQPYIDGRKLLNNKDSIGLEPQKFLSRNKLLQEGELLLGICSCGCEGCCDFTMEQKINNDVVLWKTMYRYEEITYRFDLLQYKNAVKNLERNAIRSYEKTAERIATDLLKNTILCSGYEFTKAVASVENKIITVYYRKEETLLSYTINWNGKYEYGEHIWYGDGAEVDESGDAYENVKSFIDNVLFGEEYLLTKIYYRILHDLFITYSNKNDKEPILYNRLKIALLCESRNEMIVALYYATDYIDKLIEILSYFSVSKTVIEAVKCFDTYCFRNNRGIAGAKFRKDLNIINNSLAQKVANAIISESDGVPKCSVENVRLD